MQKSQLRTSQKEKNKYKQEPIKKRRKCLSYVAKTQEHFPLWSSYYYILQNMGNEDNKNRI